MRTSANPRGAPRPALDRRVALVTGAARNIGRATAIAAADVGARVLATDRDTAGLASRRSRSSTATARAR